MMTDSLTKKLREKLQHDSLTQRIEHTKEKESYIDNIIFTNEGSSNNFFKLRKDILLLGVNKKEELFKQTERSKNLSKKNRNNNLSQSAILTHRENYSNLDKFLIRPNKDISERIKTKYNDLIQSFSATDDNSNNNKENINQINQMAQKAKTVNKSNNKNIQDVTKIKYKKDQILRILDKTFQKKNVTSFSGSTDDNSVLNKYIDLDDQTFTKRILLKSSQNFDVNLKKRSFLISKEKRIEELSSYYNEPNKKVLTLMQRMLNI